MTRSPMVGVRLEPDLLAQIDEIATEQGANRSEAIKLLIQRGLNQPDATEAPSIGIEQRLESIEQTLTNLTRSLTAAPPAVPTGWQTLKELGDRLGFDAAEPHNSGNPLTWLQQRTGKQWQRQGSPSRSLYRVVQ